MNMFRTKTLQLFVVSALGCAHGAFAAGDSIITFANIANFTVKVFAVLGGSKAIASFAKKYTKLAEDEPAIEVEVEPCLRPLDVVSMYTSDQEYMEAVEKRMKALEQAKNVTPQDLQAVVVRLQSFEQSSKTFETMQQKQASCDEASKQEFEKLLGRFEAHLSSDAEKNTLFVGINDFEQLKQQCVSKLELDQKKMVTQDELAEKLKAVALQQAVQHGFQQQQEANDRYDKHLNEFNEYKQEISGKVDGCTTTLASLQDKLALLSQRVESVETTQSAVGSQFSMNMQHSYFAGNNHHDDAMVRSQVFDVIPKEPENK